MRAHLGQFVLVHMVHPDLPPQHLDAIEVVHGQDGAPLVHVTQETKSFTLARVVVSNEIDVNLNKMRKLLLHQQSIQLVSFQPHEINDLREPMIIQRGLSQLTGSPYCENMQMTSPSVIS